MLLWIRCSGPIESPSRNFSRPFKIEDRIVLVPPLEDQVLQLLLTVSEFDFSERVCGLVPLNLGYRFAQYMKHPSTDVSRCTDAVRGIFVTSFDEIMLTGFFILIRQKQGVFAPQLSVRRNALGVCCVRIILGKKVCDGLTRGFGAIFVKSVDRKENNVFIGKYVL